MPSSPAPSTQKISEFLIGWQALNLTLMADFTHEQKSFFAGFDALLESAIQTALRVEGDIERIQEEIDTLTARINQTDAAMDAGLTVGQDAMAGVVERLQELTYACNGARAVTLSIVPPLVAEAKRLGILPQTWNQLPPPS